MGRREITIEVTDEMIDDIRKAKYYNHITSFVSHCGWDLIEAVENKYKELGLNLYDGVE